MKLDKKQILFIVIGAIVSGIVGYLIWKFEQKQTIATDQAQQAATDAAQEQSDEQAEQENQLFASLQTGYAGSVAPQYENTTAGYEEDQGETTAAPDPVTDLLDKLFPGGAGNGITQVDAGENLSQVTVTDNTPTPTVQLATSPLGASTTTPGSQLPSGGETTPVTQAGSDTTYSDPTLSDPSTQLGANVHGQPPQAITQGFV